MGHLEFGQKSVEVYGSRHPVEPADRRSRNGIGQCRRDRTRGTGRHGGDDRSLGTGCYECQTRHQAELHAFQDTPGPDYMPLESRRIASPDLSPLRRLRPLPVGRRHARTGPGSGPIDPRGVRHLQPCSRIQPLHPYGDGPGPRHAAPDRLGLDCGVAKARASGQHRQRPRPALLPDFAHGGGPSHPAGDQCPFRTRLPHLHKVPRNSGATNEDPRPGDDRSRP